MVPGGGSSEDPDLSDVGSRMTAAAFVFRPAVSINRAAEWMT
jgi:hypothetical protein